jgi:hypothetical protein
MEKIYSHGSLTVGFPIIKAAKALPWLSNYPRSTFDPSISSMEGSSSSTLAKA